MGSAPSDHSGSEPTAWSSSTTRARPLVSAELVERVAAAATRHGAAIPVVPVTDTLKRVRGDRVEATVDRADLVAAQTPQGARIDLFEAAFERLPPAGPATWTDEAALLEACTIPVHVVPGDPRNLKVTVPDDLARVRTALSGSPAVRLGFGHDSHPFGPGGPLRLGGIAFEGAPRLAGHSDGDVALHAVADALLGGAALGDLGRHFPASAATPEGIASGDLLTAVRGARRRCRLSSDVRGRDDRRRSAAASVLRSTRCERRSRGCSTSTRVR